MDGGREGGREKEGEREVKKEGEGERGRKKRKVGKGGGHKDDTLGSTDSFTSKDQRHNHGNRMVARFPTFEMTPFLSAERHWTTGGHSP